MTTDEWQNAARKRIESGEMSEEEWQEIIGALLVSVEIENALPTFCDAIENRGEQ